MGLRRNQQLEAGLSRQELLQQQLDKDLEKTIAKKKLQEAANMSNKQKLQASLAAKQEVAQLKQASEGQSVQIQNQDQTAPQGDKSQRIAAAGQMLLGASQGGATGDTGADVGGGLATGALAGYTVGGPVGAAVGAGVGGVVGALKSRAARKARERELENQKQRQLAAIEGQRADRINAAISNMSARLSSALRVPVVRI